MLEFLVTFVLPIAVFVGLVNFILWVTGRPIMDSTSSRHNIYAAMKRKRLEDDVDDMFRTKNDGSSPFDNQ